MNKPRVFVVHDVGVHNVTLAEEHGRLVPLIVGNIPQTMPIEQVAKNIADALADATPEDWLLLVGNPVVIGLATTAFLRKTGAARFLVYDKKVGRNGGYTKKTGDLQLFKGGVVRVYPEPDGSYDETSGSLGGARVPTFKKY